MTEVLPHQITLAGEKKIPAAALEEAAAILDVGVPEVVAVFEVEASGRGFRADGTVERRFEPHHMPRDTWVTLGFRVGELAPWRASLKLRRHVREAMFEIAASLSHVAAYDATSWGAPQIMGFNAEDSGHEDSISMARAMASSPAEHALSFARLCAAWGLGPAIAAHDWEAFASRYNGPANVAVYAPRLARAYARAVRSDDRSPFVTVLRRGSRGDAVRALQEALGVTADGRFGPKTEHALRAFQRSHDLTPDGVAGPKTWAAIKEAGE